MSKKRLYVPVWSLIILFVSAAAAAAAAPASLQLEPNVVSMGTMYNGAEVVAAGHAPAGADVIVQVAGEREETVLAEKGKVFGFLWMNTGEVTVRNAPSVYMLYLPEGYSANGPDAERLQSLGIGFQWLGEEAKIVAPKDTPSPDFEEFVKLKQKEGLYAVHAGAVQYGGEGDSMRSFTCRMFMPPRMRHGSYSVTAMVVKDGRVLDSVNVPLKMRRSGLPEIMAELAFKHATLYGILASVVAVLAGLLMGFVLGGGKEAH